MILKLKDKKQINKAVISYGKGNVNIEVDGRFMGCFLTFNDNFKLRTVANGFKMIKGNSSAFIYSPTHKELKDSILFTYYGILRLNTIFFYDYNKRKVYADVKEETHAVERLETNIEDIKDKVNNLNINKNSTTVDENFVNLYKKNKKKYTRFKKGSKKMSSKKAGKGGGSAGTTSGGSGY